ncbi:hypothetical protein [Corallococcus aberystwythensis]|uniref:Kazal-like domain-containing protein n=1 Tax=Corallococcus aberystwythensis TaxID=2316722 RepID=A0A3A8Q832_9BACT|nr:hypothetical protein [Corallococcus aberystwythensis]RKH63180.1 hypothetical protein D7W81_20925 [Corallococcus aberystwythensis]
MNKRTKFLLMVSAALSFAPAAALAGPPQCIDVCTYAQCSDLCNIGPGYWMTCGQYYGMECLNAPAEPSEPTASVSSEEALQAEDASLTCSEENPA